MHSGGKLPAEGRGGAYLKGCLDDQGKEGSWEERGERDRLALRLFIFLSFFSSDLSQKRKQEGVRGPQHLLAAIFLFLAYAWQ